MMPRNRSSSRAPTLLLTTLLALGLVPPQAGCASVLSALPAVTSAIVEVGNVVDTIASWVELFFRDHPDPVAEQRARIAVAKTRNAMNVVLRLADAAKSADDAEVSRAFDDLEAAYKELLDMTRPIGVRPEGVASGHVGAVASSPVLTVPATLRRPR